MIQCNDAQAIPCGPERLPFNYTRMKVWITQPLSDCKGFFDDFYPLGIADCHLNTELI